MIPLRLRLKNFLSYGPQEQTIDFEPYHLICLSGKNGHGKSALLDAMTWAVWGQARKVSTTVKPDADILRIGQTFMMVTFDFSFNGHTYRIKREYAKTFAKPYASLDFGILDPIKQKMKSLTDKTIRKTQEKIEQTIGLNYESFINTAFLRQGHANEFSKKSPKERKDILASILNLHQYEELRQRAQEKTREASTQRQQLQELQTKLKEQLEEKQDTTQELTVIKEKCDNLLKEEHAITQKQQNLTKQQNDIAQKVQALHILQFQYAHLEKEENKEQKNVQSLFATWRSVNCQLRALPDRAHLEQEKKELLESVKKQQESLQKHLQSKETYLQVKEEEQIYLSKIRDQHYTNIQNQKITIERLNSQKESFSTQLSHYCTYADKAQQELATIQKNKDTLEQKQKEYSENFDSNLEEIFEKRKAYYHTCVSRLQHIHLEQKQLAQKQQLTQKSNNPSCPLCEQNLSTSRKNFLKTKFLEQSRFYAHRRSRLERATKKLKELLIKQHTKLQELQQKQKEEQLLVSNIEEVKKAHKKTQKNLQEFITNQNETSKTIKNIESNIKTKSITLQKFEDEAKHLITQSEYYRTLEKKLKKLEHILKKTMHDAAYHKEIENKLEKIENTLQIYENLLQEQAQQKQRKKDIFSLIRSLKTKKKEKQHLQKEQNAFAQIEKKQQNLKVQQEQLLQEYKQIQNQKETLLQEKGRLEQQKTYLEKQKKEFDEQEKKIKELKQDTFEYSAIATALSKNGIQALLIEDAIPEIEHEANIILAQLTDNQTHIMIESVRDLKKGGTRETLDINISDPMGIRPYELFSGGETFRIDFALRIAISKLLARRAGTSLQTLIIDEGFGSQDEEGLSRLMDAIHKIQDNFCKVIIVSHLPALKDQFPVHFVVTKGLQGSTLQVVEQG